MGKQIKAAFISVVLGSTFVAGGLYGHMVSLPSDKQVAEIQVAEVIRHTKFLYASQPDFGDGNLVPVLSTGRDGEFPTNTWVPVMATGSEQREYLAKNLRVQAMKGVTFVSGGEDIDSDIIGRITVEGRGRSFIVGLPECPESICAKDQITVSK